MFGSGISPGFAELLAIVATAICDRVDKVTVNEAADTTFYDSPDTETPAGFGQPIDNPDLPGDGGARHGGVRRGRPPRGPGHRRRARRGAVRRRVRPDHRGPRPGLVDDRGRVRRRCAASWQGIVDGRDPRRAQRAWRKGTTLEPDWKIEQDGWVIQIDGRPTVTLNVGFLPPPYFEAETMDDFMVLGHIMTAMPPINAVPAVVAARAGHRHLRRPAPHPRPAVSSPAESPWTSRSRRPLFIQR